MIGKDQSMVYLPEESELKSSEIFSKLVALIAGMGQRFDPAAPPIRFNDLEQPPLVAVLLAEVVNLESTLKVAIVLRLKGKCYHYV